MIDPENGIFETDLSHENKFAAQSVPKNVKLKWSLGYSLSFQNIPLKSRRSFSMAEQQRVQKW